MHTYVHMSGKALVLLCLVIVSIGNKARGFEEQNNTVRWFVKLQQVKLLSTTREILVIVLQIL